MPIYTFKHPKTQKTIEVKQAMIDEHVYVDENGLEWNRVWDEKVEIGVVYQRLVEGKRYITNIDGKKIPKDKMKTRCANFMYHYSCKETPETT